MLGFKSGHGLDLLPGVWVIPEVGITLSDLLQFVLVFAFLGDRLTSPVITCDVLLAKSRQSHSLGWNRESHELLLVALIYEKNYESPPGLILM